VECHKRGQQFDYLILGAERSINRSRPRVFWECLKIGHTLLSRPIKSLVYMIRVGGLVRVDGIVSGRRFTMVQT
jgi:hypothetical protein